MSSLQPIIARARAFCDANGPNAEVVLIDAEGVPRAVAAISQSPRLPTIIAIAVFLERQQHPNGPVISICAANPEHFVQCLCDVPYQGACLTAIAMIATLLDVHLAKAHRINIISNGNAALTITTSLNSRVSSFLAKDAWSIYAPHIAYVQEESTPKDAHVHVAKTFEVSPSLQDRKFALDQLTNIEISAIFARQLIRTGISRQEWCISMQLRQNNLDRFLANLSYSAKMRECIVEWLITAPSIPDHQIAVNAPSASGAAETKPDCPSWAPPVERGLSAQSVELVAFYRQTWSASHNQFCRDHRLDPFKFSKYIRGIREYAAGREAIAQWFQMINKPAQ